MDMGPEKAGILNPACFTTISGAFQSVTGDS
jgi:hypothetical protein